MKKVLSSLLALGVAFSFSDLVRADILEKEVRSSDGKSSVTGYVYQHDRSVYRRTSRSRDSRDPIISDNPGMIQVVPIAQFTSDTSAPLTTTQTVETKPRFGYGSDYRSSQVEKDPRISPVEPKADKGEYAPVPPADYPDSDIPSVPSYSDPNPQPVTPYQPKQAPESKRMLEPTPNNRDRPDSSGEVPSLVGEFLQALPSLLAPRDVETPQLKEWAPPRIEFNLDPPVHREFLPVVPHFVDPHCAPAIRTPFGHQLPFGGHVPHPFGNGVVTPFGHSPHFGNFLPNPFCPPFGH